MYGIVWSATTCFWYAKSDRTGISLPCSSPPIKASRKVGSISGTTLMVSPPTRKGRHEEVGEVEVGDGCEGLAKARTPPKGLREAEGQGSNGGRCSGCLPWSEGAATGLVTFIPILDGAICLTGGDLDIPRALPSEEIARCVTYTVATTLTVGVNVFLMRLEKGYISLVSVALALDLPSLLFPWFLFLILK